MAGWGHLLRGGLSLSSGTLGGHHGYQPLGVGSLAGGSSDQGLLVPLTEQEVIKLEGVGGCLFGSEGLLPVSAGFGCSDQDGQRHGHGLCEQAGGGTRSLSLVAVQLFSWAESYLLALSAIHNQGVPNSLADALSRAIPSLVDFCLRQECLGI